MPDLAPRPAGLATVRVPLDDVADRGFWEYCRENELDGTPLYYRPFLERKPDRCAAAIAAVADAKPGGVLIHCGGGRDRTGLITLLLLALAQVEPEEIVADYEHSNTRLPPFWAQRGMNDQRPIINDILERKNTTARALILELLATVDIEARLRCGGLSDNDIAAVRARLLQPITPE